MGFGELGNWGIGELCFVEYGYSILCFVFGGWVPRERALCFVPCGIILGYYYIIMFLHGFTLARFYFGTVLWFILCISVYCALVWLCQCVVGFLCGGYMSEGCYG